MTPLQSDLKAPWPSHGGQRNALLAHFGLPDNHPLLDFSTNLNPLGPPKWVAAQLASLSAGLALYPDPTYTNARRAIADSEGVSPDQVCLTNGGSEAIFLAASLFAGQKAAILQPAFGEYARACDHYQIAITQLPLQQPMLMPGHFPGSLNIPNDPHDNPPDPLPDFLPDEALISEAIRQQDLILIARPNNPTATLIPAETISRWLALAEQFHCTLIIDEAFIDFCHPSEPGLVEHLQQSCLHQSRHLILLRSMTKLYTLPGLRLGYILAHADLIRRLLARQIPWSVNHLAAELVAPLLADWPFLQATAHWLKTESDWLLPQLHALGYRIPTPAANFFLLQDANTPAEEQSSADALFRHLLQQGILARHTHNFTGLNGKWLRLAIRSREENQSLLAALQSWREQNRGERAC
ncbi:pyridoxal phosphate-dependent aminotransferase [Nitrincola sp. MINF-07-Sa-05]|uniref:pyridoxal phosphate-dependent aminotransferase n=1 Tax=Nitrincola salilacus TaxID=3400273 RepID=UPI00391825D7